MYKESQVACLPWALGFEFLELIRMFANSMVNTLFSGTELGHWIMFPGMLQIGTYSWYFVSKLTHNGSRIKRGWLYFRRWSYASSCVSEPQLTRLYLSFHKVRRSDSKFQIQHQDSTRIPVIIESCEETGWRGAKYMEDYSIFMN